MLRCFPLQRLPIRLLLVCCVSLLGQFSPVHVEAGEPLHKRIDALVAAKAGGQPLGPAADDYEFVRRVYLDLAGRIPSIEEAQGFVGDKAADKRAKLVDQLLAGPAYAQNMSNRFHVMLMERRGDHELWQKFLYDSFAANKPWDALVRDILAADSEDEAIRGGAFFYTKRLESYGQNPVDFPGLTRDVGRMFLGRDLQCAQCHNDLFVDDYKQLDFQGLFAVYSNLALRTDVKFPAVKEKPLTKKLQFVSVFDPTERETGPRLPSGREFAAPEAPKGQSPGLLKILAAELPRPDDESFKANIANRLWWMMMGRGLVRPLDRHHGANPASHPELLTLLGNEFAEHKFDIKWMLRELALTETYARTSRLPTPSADANAADNKGAEPGDNYLLANERSLSAEQLWASLVQATMQPQWDGHQKPAGIPESLSKLVGELKPHVTGAFAGEARESEEDLSPSVKGALFLSNDSRVLALLQPNENNLIARLVKISDAAELAETLYLALLTRIPTDDEKRDVAAFLSRDHLPRDRLIGHLAWAVLTSTEFCVNH